MPGVGVGTVLPDEWNIPDKQVGQYRYSHKTRPYIIEIEGYRITLLNHVTGNMVNKVEKDEFDALCTLMKMGAMPRAVLDDEVTL